MQGFPERGGPPDLAQLQSTMQTIELACTSIQVLKSFFCSIWLLSDSEGLLMIIRRNPHSHLLRICEKNERFERKCKRNEENSMTQMSKRLGNDE